MTFAHPLWIPAGLIFCLGTILLLRRLGARRQAALERFAAASLLHQLTRNVSTKRQSAKQALFLLALFCCFLALARPQYGFHWEDTKRKGIDILFAVDTSKSMLAKDIKPNRLERAKFAIMDFVDQLNGDRVGLLPFAGTAFLFCPLTGDYNAFEESLKAIDTTIIPQGGTDIAAAIRKAQSVLTSETNFKLLILITDGENLEGDAVAAAEEAAQHGMRIFTVGVGTREGEIIPLSSDGGTQGFVKDAAGNFVVSHLDEATLTRIAEKSNGLYAPLGNKGQGLQTIYQKKLALVPKEELAERRRKVPVERFEWPLAIAIGLLALEFIVGTRKSSPFRLSFLTNSGDKPRLLGILLLAGILFCLPPSASASEGETAFSHADYPKAVEYYGQLLKKHPDDPKILFNYGAAAYKTKKFDDAIAAFTGALKSTDLHLQEKAYYNKGNALYKKGEEMQQTDPQQTFELWQQAIESYSASHELNPGDRNVIANRDFVRKKISQLKKQQEKQAQHNQQNPPSDQEKGNKDQAKQQNAQPPGQQQRPESGQNLQNRDEQKQGGTNEQEEKSALSRQHNAQSPNRQQESAPERGVNDQDKRQQGDSIASHPSVPEENDKVQNKATEQERRRQGKMTTEDAERLLDSLKTEEGRLNMLPVEREETNHQPKRDW